jgi:hypothetical protein
VTTRLEGGRAAPPLGAPRPLGAGVRAAGLIEQGSDGLDLLRQSVELLTLPRRCSNVAKSLAELAAALRRNAHRPEACNFFEQGLDVA